MKFLDIVKKRQSVRSYSDRLVEREKIELCLEAARLAPSASNSQPWRFIVVDEPELRKKLAKTTFGPVLSFNKFVLEAPVLVLVVSERQKVFAKFGQIIKQKIFSQMDVGIAVEHFCLQAAELDLGTCILGWFDEGVAKKLLNVPKGKRIELMISLGYPASSKIRDKKRKSLAEVRGYNRY